MTDKAVLLFAKVSAAQIEAKALEAENSFCASVARNLPYGEEAFDAVAKKIQDAIAEFQKPSEPVIPGEPPLGKCEDKIKHRDKTIQCVRELRGF